MKESDLIKWYEKHAEILKTFDLDQDGQYSFHEIRWAVKVSKQWADKVGTDREAEHWFFAESGRVHGPVSWSILVAEGRAKFVKFEQSPYWLPFVVINKIAEEGLEEEDETSDITESVSTSQDQAKAQIDPVQEEEAYFSQKYEHIWEEENYIIETTNLSRGYYSGSLYTLDKKMLLRICPDPTSEHVFARFGRGLGPQHHSTVWGSSHRRRGNRYILANSLYLKTPTGENVYRLKREYFAWLFPYKTDVYDLTNPQLGQLYESTIQFMSFGFYSYGKIDRGASKVPIRVSGPFWQLEFKVGKRLLATALKKLPKGIDWVTKPRNIYAIRMYDRKVSPAPIIHYILSIKRTFWLLDSYKRE